MVINLESFTIVSPNGEINGDVHLAKEAKGIVVFAHGYKGFKDWGAWGLLGDLIAESGYHFVKFNFSHNGHSSEKPLDCTETEKWACNNYRKEVEDCEEVVKWVSDRFNLLNLCLMGHSRGGGVAAITAAKCDKVKKLILLASVSDYKARFPEGEKLLEWERTDRLEVVNGRTGQVLYHKYSFYENFLENEEELNIEKAVKSLNIPLCVIHGTEDQAVPSSEAISLKSWGQNSELHLIENAGHTFNTKHPWDKKELPVEAVEVLNVVKGFFKIVEA